MSDWNFRIYYSASNGATTTYLYKNIGTAQAPNFQYRGQGTGTTIYIPASVYDSAIAYNEAINFQSYGLNGQLRLFYRNEAWINGSFNSTSWHAAPNSTDGSSFLGASGGYDNLRMNSGVNGDYRYIAAIYGAYIGSTTIRHTLTVRVDIKSAPFFIAHPSPNGIYSTDDATKASSHTITAELGNSHQTTNAKWQYQYSFDSGATWSSGWTDVGAGNTSSTKTHIMATTTPQHRRYRVYAWNASGTAVSNLVTICATQKYTVANVNATGNYNARGYPGGENYYSDFSTSVTGGYPNGAGTVRQILIEENYPWNTSTVTNLKTLNYISIGSAVTWRSQAVGKQMRRADGDHTQAVDYQIQGYHTCNLTNLTLGYHVIGGIDGSVNGVSGATRVQLYTHAYYIQTHTGTTIGWDDSHIVSVRVAGYFSTFTWRWEHRVSYDDGASWSTYTESSGVSPSSGTAAANTGADGRELVITATFTAPFQIVARYQVRCLVWNNTNLIAYSGAKDIYVEDPAGTLTPDIDGPTVMYERTEAYFYDNSTYATPANATRAWQLPTGFTLISGTLGNYATASGGSSSIRVQAGFVSGDTLRTMMMKISQTDTPTTVEASHQLTVKNDYVGSPVSGSRGSAGGYGLEIRDGSQGLINFRADDKASSLVFTSSTRNVGTTSTVNTTISHTLASTDRLVWAPISGPSPRLSGSGNTVTMTGPGYPLNSTSSGRIMVFSTSVAPATGDYGMEVYSTSVNQERVFSTAQKSLQCAEKWEVGFNNWVRGNQSFLFSNAEPAFYYDITFSHTYNEGPIVALRSKNFRNIFQPQVSTGTMRVFSDSSDEVLQVVLLAPAGTYGGNPIINGSDYGMVINDASGGVAFDTRWWYASCVDTAWFPNITVSNPGTLIESESTPVTRTHAECPQAFYCLNGIGGIKTRKGTTSGTIITSYYGGGIHRPTIRQVSSTSVVADAPNLGSPGSNANTQGTLSGYYLVFDIPSWRL